VTFALIFQKKKKKNLDSGLPDCAVSAICTNDHIRYEDRVVSAGNLDLVWCILWLFDFEHTFAVDDPFRGDFGQQQSVKVWSREDDVVVSCPVCGMVGHVGTEKTDEAQGEFEAKVKALIFFVSIPSGVD